MLMIPTHKLAAAIPCAATKDIRYYLNSVHLEITSNGTLHIISTNGHSLFAGKVDNPDWLKEAPAGGFSITIPLDVVKAATKSKDKALTLEALENGRYILGDHMFTAMGGTYPDWRRVAKLVEGEEQPSQFNPDYLVACTKALKTWNNEKATFMPYVHSRGDSAGAITGTSDDAFCILMPVRVQKIARFEPFIPCDR